ncbi:MAG: hypothetical protein HY960_14385 [Ignavibacteriae bacterium]|nr:hypothetical protein [Ignavibacteriota bacterium]
MRYNRTSKKTSKRKKKREQLFIVSKRGNIIKLSDGTQVRITTIQRPVPQSVRTVQRPLAVPTKNQRAIIRAVNVMAAISKQRKYLLDNHRSYQELLIAV